MRSKKITEYVLETIYPKGYEAGGSVKVQIVFRPNEILKFVVQCEVENRHSYHWLLCDATLDAQEQCEALTAKVTA